MVSLHSLLDRFRPAPPPGQPGPLGVPSQTPHTVEEELAPVFALVDAIDAECAAIEDDGRRRAARIADGAADRVSRISAAAEQQADAERAAAMRTVRADAEKRITTMLATARRDADDIARQESMALPERAQRAVDRVRAIGATERTAGE